MTARKLGSFTSGESEAVTGSGPNEPATKRGVPVSFPIRSAAVRAILAAARFISWTSSDELGILDHPLEEGGVFAAAFGFAGEKKIVLADGGGAEGVGLDDVGAGRQILGVDFFNHLRMGELEEFEVALEMFGRMMGEARAAVLFLGEFVALHHRAHGAVEDDDALAEELGERVKGGGVHGEGAS